MSMLTLQDLAEDFARDLASDAQTGDCPDTSGPHQDHRLGTKLTCPHCWAWQAARKVPVVDQRTYVRGILAEQRELAGETNLDGIATELVRILGTGNPTDSIFFSELASTSIRCAYMLNISTSRRRRTLHELVAFLILDPKVAVGSAVDCRLSA